MQNIISVLNRYLSHINMPSVNIIDVIEILLISVFVYQFMVWIKYTRAYTLLKGLLIISAFLLVAYIFKMNTILWIVSNLSSVLIMAVIVIFQPELRKIVEQLGQKRIMSAIIPFDVGKEVKERFTDKTINELVKACFDMGEVKTGAGAEYEPLSVDVNLSNTWFCTSFSYVLLRLKGYTNPGQAAPPLDIVLDHLDTLFHHQLFYSKHLLLFDCKNQDYNLLKLL